MQATPKRWRSDGARTSRRRVKIALSKKAVLHGIRGLWRNRGCRSQGRQPTITKTTNTVHQQYQHIYKQLKWSFLITMQNATCTDGMCSANE
mmetsp:Transcript_30164/g.63914  ORF Transcript_30164/g.63914 Transcript_30164/m.63914 type:complete len:92 (+) Transcript_30164:1077-1352(+)